MTSGRKDTNTQQKKEIFLEALLKAKFVTPTCKALGLRRSTVYEWLNDDPDFKARYEAAKVQVDKMILEEVEERLHHIGVRGVDKPVTWKGKITGHYKEFDTTALIFRAKAIDPVKYRDNHKVNVDTAEDFKTFIADLASKRGE